MRNMEKEIVRRGVTYSQWKSGHEHTMDRRGWHPITFDSAKTTLNAIKDIQACDFNFLLFDLREFFLVDTSAIVSEEFDEI